MKTRSEAFLNKANENLNIAKEELFKPKEDMVSYSICKNSQIAIENFFKGYLTKNKIAIAPDETIDTLFKKCIGFNEKFKEIDLAALSCKGHVIDSRYCSDISKVTSCFDTADAIDTFFRKNKII